MYLGELKIIHHAPEYNGFIICFDSNSLQSRSLNPSDTIHDKPWLVFNIILIGIAVLMSACATDVDIVYRLKLLIINTPYSLVQIERVSLRIDIFRRTIIAITGP